MRVAELVVAEQPGTGLVPSRPRARGRTNRIFLADARVLFAEVAAHTELFTALGLGADLLAAMEEALNAFEEPGTAATDGRDGHREARELVIEAVMADCMRPGRRARHLQPGPLRPDPGDARGLGRRPRRLRAGAAPPAGGGTA